MKNTVLIISSLVLLTFVACNSSSSESNSESSSSNSPQQEEVVENQGPNIEGKWMIIHYLKKDGSKMELQACDSAVVWDFTTEDAEVLSDGTQTKKLIASAPESCKFYDFEAKWTMYGGDLFISTTRFGGIGGVSHAGLFKIKNFRDIKFEIESGGNTMVFLRR